MTKGQNFLQTYLHDLFKTFRAGRTTEPSFYPDLKKLLEAYLTSKGVAPHVTIEERKTESGKPDFVVRKGRGELVGYVEAKDISVEDLQTAENTDQIRRYKTLPNFILTNYFDFWLWREGAWTKKIRIGMPSVLKRVRVAPPAQKEDEFLKLLDLFFSYYIPEKKSAKTLAKELADRAKLMPDFIIHELANDETDEIDRIYEAFREYLITDLSKEDFADIYSQTITYGLFTARLQYPKKDFNRFIAAEHIPKNIQILHDTFSLISSTALPESITWIVDDIATVLAHADIEAIKEELRTKRGADDPLIHFYETFLAEYDPKKRKSRGVYYTPSPVVSFITRSINILLKEKFGVKEGFAGKNVTFLDPASGTLTFPAQAIKLAIDEYSRQWGSGGIKSLIKDHILRNFYAFEILMAPYVIGHLKISLLLQDFGYEFNISKKTDRFKLYLTNTLDFDPVKESNLPFAFALSEEAKKAEKVKKEEKILVILGNPPYSSSATEPTKFCQEKMKDYLTGLGVEEEKKKGAIQDDYVRFIRFAHWKLEQAGRGILGFISNNSYLDGLVHRAMRKKLLDTFDGIYILNLHGNSRIKETTPEGGKDENVFDIQQGVAIGLFINTGKERKDTKIFYQDVWGLREKKYKFLENKDVNTTKWQKIEPRERFYFFVPKDYSVKEIYDKFLSFTDIFDQYVSGVETKRDNLVVDFDNCSLENRIRTFKNTEGDDKFIQQIFDLSPKSDLDISNSQRILRGSNLDISDFIFSYVYRPFESRWIFYHDSLVSRTRKPLMSSLLSKDNLALVTMRQYVYSAPYSHAFVANTIVDRRVFISNRGAAYVFPLYLYGEKEVDLDPRKQQSFLPSDQTSLKAGGKRSNIKEEFVTLLNNACGVSPEEIFYYIYAVLYSNIYRQKYEEFLKIDFPRIPFTKDCRLFQKLANLGKQLVDLHLLKARELSKPTAKFQGRDSNKIEKRDYDKKAQRVYINDLQYFERIEPEVWNYYIGGYQVLDKWLKDRSFKKLNRGLNDQEVRYYCKVVTALAKTIEIQDRIDKLYPKVEKNLI